MIDYQLSSIARITGGTLNNNDICIRNICTDSRQESIDTLFIPIKGVHYDGHDFIDSALKNGCTCFISEKNIQSDYPYVLVNNTLSAYNKIAAHYASQMNSMNIAITGSTGKTSLKDLLYDAIESKNKIKTKGNTNNLIGVTQNILRIEKETEFAVLEAGMNQKGELIEISQMIKPHAVIITTINDSHIGMFASFEDLIEAKMEILESMNTSSVLLINGDNRMVLKHIPGHVRYRTFGIGPDNDYHPCSFKLNQDNAELVINGNEYKINIPGSGALQMILALYAFKNEYKDVPVNIEYALKNFSMPHSRLNISQTGDILMIDDTYNASPASMKNALDVLSRFKGRKIAILGDMLELGKQSAELHKEIALYANEKNIDMIWAIGKFSENYIRDYRDRHFNSKDELSDYVSIKLEKNDVILIKGSRGMAMEEIINHLKDM